MGFISNCPAFNEKTGQCGGDKFLKCWQVVVEQYCDCLYNDFKKKQRIEQQKEKENKMTDYERLYELAEHWRQESDFCGEQSAYSTKEVAKAEWLGRRYAWHEAAKYLELTLKELEDES